MIRTFDGLEVDTIEPIPAHNLRLGSQQEVDPRNVPHRLTPNLR